MTDDEWLKKHWRLLVVSREDARTRLSEVDSLPAGPGVYVIVTRDDMTPIYVGSSIDTHSRGRQHYDDGAHRHMAFSLAVPKVWLKAVEGEYITALKPPGNARSPGGVPGGIPLAEAIKAAWCAAPSRSGAERLVCGD